MNIIKVAYVFVTTLIGVLLLYQQSIAIYWQQAYHQVSPLSSLQAWLPFSSITALNQHLLDAENKYITLVQEWNEQFQEQYNQRVIGKTLSPLEPDNVVGRDMTSHDLPTVIEPDPVALNLSYEKIKALIDIVTIDHQSLANIEMGSDNTAEISGKNEMDILSGSDLSGGHQLSEPSIQPIVLETKDKILFIGDSLMQGVAPRVKRALYQQYHIESLDISKQSTGLAYPRAFDWPKTVESTLDKDPAIKLLVVFLGPNDPWDFPVKGQPKYLKFKSIEWETAYRERIQRILTAATLHQTQVIWLGAPCMRKKALHSSMVYLNTLYRDEIAKINAHYIPTSELLGCSDEEYANSVVTEKGNIKVRINDGIHFTVYGQNVIAQRIIDEITIKHLEQDDKVEQK